MVVLISSQSHIDDDIVQEKINEQDFEVQVSPIFELEGVEFQVIQDGHHSYHAALISGREPEFVEQTAEQNDRILLLDQDVELFLQASYIDTDWYNIETGEVIW